MNEFIIDKLADGTVKVSTPGGFRADLHKQADDLLNSLEELIGGRETAKLPKSLANPQQQSHQHGHGHHHH